MDFNLSFSPWPETFLGELWVILESSRVGAASSRMKVALGWTPAKIMVKFLLVSSGFSLEENSAPTSQLYIPAERGSQAPSGRNSQGGNGKGSQ